MLALLTWSWGCATPAERYDDAAFELGFARQTLRAGEFELVSYYPAGGPSGPRLHVYLEGDGTPIRGGRPALDPTTRRPVALRLMALDPAPAVLLGRPCYHGEEATPPCGARLWTHARYSEDVVAALTTGLAALPAQELVLVGFSGGGALAMLLAARDARVVAVVTLAANLDVTAWTAWHGYDALVGSLDPAREPPLSMHILQIHLAGERDERVPPAVIGPVPGGALRIVHAADHDCCWAASWRDVLKELSSTLR